MKRTILVIMAVVMMLWINLNVAVWIYELL